MFQNEFDRASSPKGPFRFLWVLVLLFGGCVSGVASAAQIETSFEKAKPGEFRQLDCDIGTWSKATGTVKIDDQHAKSGKQCLQIAGKESSVELTIATGYPKGGRLSFWAERWTSRSPFSFRIEKFSNEKWQEIFNGDQEIKVGRAFLSRIEVPLRDASIKKLRFSVSSPPQTGVLIDDVRIAPSVPQKVTSAEAIPFTLPALIGAERCALVQVKVTTTGTLQPISLTGVDASILQGNTKGNIEKVTVVFGGSDPKFKFDSPIAESQWVNAQGKYQFNTSQLLAEGDNFVWLACKLDSHANIDKTIAAKVDSISFSNGDLIQLEGPPSIQRLGVSVRSAGDDGVHTYRIPGLATTNNGTLIGVYDIRRDRGGDLPGNIDVGMSRSLDGGRTWEPMRVIMDMGDDPKWNGDGIGDPSILIDRKTGAIWVSGTWSHGNRSWNGSGPGLKPEETGQWMMVRSDDDGLSWSKPINITRQVKNPEWSFLLQGPGKGISMSDGTLVFPAQYQDPPNAKDKTANRLPRSTIIYSQDHGESWQIGTGAWDDTTESQVVELEDGRLMLNCRFNRASRRVVMTSDDLGKTWQKHLAHINDLIEPRACMASLINVGRELAWRGLEGANNETLLFSNPDSLTGRNHITIKASTDAGESWPAEHHLLLDEQTGAGYSCLSMIDKDNVGILYEGSQAQMSFQRIKLADVLNPPSDQKTKNPAVASLRRPARKAKAAKTLTLARPFGDHMVLQADQPIRVWGTAMPNQKVSVKLANEEALATKSDPNGNWQIELPVRPASKDPVTLTVNCAGDEVTIADVLIGEVWFCAGQSNMEWELVKSAGGEDAILTTADRFLRLHNCPAGASGNSGVYTATEANRLWPETFSSGQWKTSSPASAAPFSAVAYYFAKRLRKELDVPVGMINVSVGGTPIESWVSETRLKSSSELSQLYDGNWLNNPKLDRWCRSRAKLNLRDTVNGTLPVPTDEFGPNHPFKPGFMFRAGVEPFLPMSIRGVLWYQGESNADSVARINVYDECFPLLVQDWRTGFQNDTLPIVFVQLPAMGRPNWPLFRERQRRSLSRLSNVAMAITIDTGHETDVHPKDKKSVGDRLANCALVETYGQPGTSSGPMFRSLRIKGQIAEVTFDYAGSGLRTRDGKAPLHFEISGADGKYHVASAKIVKEKVLVSCPNVTQPVNVRYAWAPFPKPRPNLVNSSDLPASPFATEEELGRTE